MRWESAWREPWHLSSLVMSTSSSSSNSQKPDSCPVDHNARRAWVFPQSISASCNSTRMDQSPPLDHPSPSPTNAELGTRREISSIPRANREHSNSEHISMPVPAAVSGNWIYPSEEMFFNAMKRKSWDPKADDMRTIVPIHNAVNERAWAEIKHWEAGRGSEA